MGITIQYINPYGQTVTFNEGAPVIGGYTLLDYEGLDNNMMSPMLQKSPYQIGASLTGASYEPRIVTTTVLLYENTDALLHTRMRELSAALVVRPVTPGQVQPLGKLKVTVNGIAYEIDCLPQMSPQFSSDEGEGIRYADIEFICPRPNWRAVTVTTSALTTAPNSAFVTNTGDMPTPAIFTLTGPLMNPSIESSTGEKIVFNYYLLVGETITVNTAFGNKSAVWSKAATPSKNMLPFIDHSVSTFFQLNPGNNSIAIKRTDASTGKMQISFQAEYNGIGA